MLVMLDSELIIFESSFPKVQPILMKQWEGTCKRETLIFVNLGVLHIFCPLCLLISIVEIWEMMAKEGQRPRSIHFVNRKHVLYMNGLWFWWKLFWGGCGCYLCLIMWLSLKLYPTFLPSNGWWRGVFFSWDFCCWHCCYVLFAALEIATNEKYILMPF